MILLVLALHSVARIQTRPVKIKTEPHMRFGPPEVNNFNLCLFTSKLDYKDMVLVK